MNIYALTPTGARPEGMALLGEYLDAQTYKGPVTWVIVDDCDPATKIPKVRKGIDVIGVRPEWRWRPGMNTQIECMRAGLLEVPEDAVLFCVEDDDIYMPRYIETILSSISDYELIGERDARYYNVATGKWRTIKGNYHSSMASTACRGEALKTLRDVCQSRIKKMLDFTLWKTFKGKKQLLPTHNVIGIKGMPGRAGIGVGHRRNFGSVDIHDTLRTWVGDYADNYGIFRGAT